MNQFETFVQLHNAEEPVLIGNIWDAGSARILEENGFKAIATSSAAVAISQGYEDGENMPFSLLFETAERIKKSISVPLSVDLEKGFSNSVAGIIDNIERLYDIGVVGINIEDSSPTNSKELQSPDEFVRKLSAIANHLSQNNRPVFINARTDAFLIQLPAPLTETKKRLKAYENAGASGLFVPFVKAEDDIREVVAATALPINVLSMPHLPDIATLTASGVRRISLGSSLFRAINREIVQKIEGIRQQQSLQGLF